MSNNITVKEVDFLGTNLLAIQQKETGKIYTAINFILRGLGFDDTQIRYQRDKWIEDKVICKGVRKFYHPSKSGGNQETYCIVLNKLPLALAKINITPRMQSEIPELSEKLELYQDKCADVLSDAFFEDVFTNKPVRTESIETINEAANIIIPVVDAVGIEPIHKTYLLKQLYDKAGIEIPMLRVEQDTQLYDKTMIADKLGIYSISNKPHAQAVGAIIKKLDVDDNNIILTSFNRNGHTGTDYQYKPMVMQQISQWLEDNKYPKIIDDDNKRYKVTYKKMDSLF